MIAESISSIREQLLCVDSCLEVIYTEIDYLQKELQKNNGITNPIQPIEV